MKRTALSRLTPLRRGGRVRPIRPRTRDRQRAWSLFRAQVWERDGHRCVLCREDVLLEVAEIQHRLPRSRGGQDTHANTITMCRRCHHERVHAYPAWATATGYTVPTGVDPAAWPVLRRGSRYPDGLWAVPDDVTAAWIVTAPDPDQHDEPAPWDAAA